ncbi:MAG: NifU family protein [bacterium]|nr:NifU family protein [bacterium]
MREEIEAVLRDEVGPMLATHGGGVELVEVGDGGVVRVRLRGGCAGCPGARMTIAQVVEATLRRKVPGVTRVEAVE